MCFFHKTWSGTDAIPLAAELKLAATLIAQHGEANARQIVEYAIAHARKTGFAMETFGAIKVYRARAETALRKILRDQAIERALENPRALTAEETERVRALHRVDAEDVAMDVDKYVALSMADTPRGMLRFAIEHDIVDPQATP